MTLSNASLSAKDTCSPCSLLSVAFHCGVWQIAPAGNVHTHPAIRARTCDGARGCVYIELEPEGSTFLHGAGGDRCALFLREGEEVDAPIEAM